MRGAKPVTVYFGKYEDKEEVLRQVEKIFLKKTKKMNIIHHLTQSKELKNHKKGQYIKALFVWSHTINTITSTIDTSYS